MNIDDNMFMVFTDFLLIVLNIPEVFHLITFVEVFVSISYVRLNMIKIYRFIIFSYIQYTFKNNRIVFVNNFFGHIDSNDTRVYKCKQYSRVKR